MQEKKRMERLKETYNTFQILKKSKTVDAYLVDEAIKKHNLITIKIKMSCF